MRLDRTSRRVDGTRPVSCENGDPRVPIFTGNWGPYDENGDPQCNTLLDIDWTAWL